MGRQTHGHVFDRESTASTLAIAHEQCLPGLKPTQETLAISAGNQVSWCQGHAVFLLKHGFCLYCWRASAGQDGCQCSP